MTDLMNVDEDGDWWLAVGGSELAERVLTAMRKAFMAAADHKGETPVYLVWAIVDASEPEAVAGAIPAPSLDALQAFLYEDVNELFGEAHPYEIVRYVELRARENGVAVVDEGTDLIQDDG